MKKYFAECIGTFVLTLLGCGTAMFLGCDTPAGVVGTALAFGLTVAACSVLAACRKGDPGTREKKLADYEFRYDYNDPRPFATTHALTRFSYDSEGRLVGEHILRQDVVSEEGGRPRSVTKTKNGEAYHTTKTGM